LTGTSPTAVAGVATGTDLTIDKVGTGYTMTFTVVGSMPVINSAVSAGFDIMVGDVASLEIVQQPNGVKAARVLTTQPTVRGRDLGGNVSPMVVGVQARLAMTVGGATISGVGTAGDAQQTIDSVAGLASFTNLQIDALVGTLPA